MADFWQLIVEQECQAIVMLNTMDPQDEVSRCGQNELSSILNDYLLHL